MTASAAYSPTNRYDGAVLQHGERDDELASVLLQDRDVAIIFDCWRYRFVTSEQLRELHWPASTDPRSAQIRLTLLFRTGYLERVRPWPRRREGSHPWSYYLGARGHEVLQRVGLVERRTRYQLARVFDFGRVVHDVEVNAWVLALRRLVGESLRTWRGEREAVVVPSMLARQGQLRLLERWTPGGLRAGARQIRPDALLEVALPSGKLGRLYVEHDRTERPDKNYDKLLRYDSFLTWWGGESAAGENAYAVFVCRSEASLAAFVAAADEHLTGHLAHPAAKAAEHVYVGRQRTLLVLERTVYDGRLDGVRVPAFPPGHPSRSGSAAEPVALPIADAETELAAA